MCRVSCVRYMVYLAMPLAPSLLHTERPPMPTTCSQNAIRQQQLVPLSTPHQLVNQNLIENADVQSYQRSERECKITRRRDRPVADNATTPREREKSRVDTHPGDYQRPSFYIVLFRRCSSHAHRCAPSLSIVTTTQARLRHTLFLKLTMRAAHILAPSSRISVCSMCRFPLIS